MINELKCKLFYCGKRKGYYCCHSYEKIQECNNRCLNTPEKCNCTVDFETCKKLRCYTRKIVNANP